MTASDIAVFGAQKTTSKSSATAEFAWRPFSVRRTAASEELSIFEREEITERLGVRWMDDPPLLKPSETLLVQLSYTVGGRLEFPPLGEEDESSLKSTSLE